MIALLAGADLDFVISFSENSGKETEPVSAEASVQKGVRTMGGIKVQVRPTVGTRSASNKVRNSNKQEHLEKVWVEVDEQPEIHNFVARLGLQRPLDPAKSTFIQYNKLFIKKSNFRKEFLTKLVYMMLSLLKLIQML